MRSQITVTLCANPSHNCFLTRSRHLCRQLISSGAAGGATRGAGVAAALPPSGAVTELTFAAVWAQRARAPARAAVTAAPGESGPVVVLTAARQSPVVARVVAAVAGEYRRAGRDACVTQIDLTQPLDAQLADVLNSAAKPVGPSGGAPPTLVFCLGLSDAECAPRFGALRALLALLRLLRQSPRSAERLTVVSLSPVGFALSVSSCLTLGESAAFSGALAGLVRSARLEFRAKKAVQIATLEVHADISTAPAEVAREVVAELLGSARGADDVRLEVTQASAARFVRRLAVAPPRAARSAAARAVPTQVSLFYLPVHFARILLTV